MNAKVLGNRYRLDTVLGVGGMGRVYRAWDSVLDRPVAVKVLRTELLGDDPSGKYVERFRREARIVAGFDHPGIVHVYDLGSDTLDGETVHYLVMQLLSGATLQQWHRTDGPLEPAQLVQVMADVLAALQHAHERGVVHRDVKPANVMLTERGTVKVMDFGIAHLRGASHLLTGTGNIIGTVAYLSPEQARDSRSADARSDVYSVGCMLYHLLANQLPFPGDMPWQVLTAQLEHRYVPVSEVRPSLGPLFDPVLGRALALDPDERYQSAAAMRTEMLMLQASLPQALDLAPRRKAERVDLPPQRPEGVIGEPGTATALSAPTATQAMADLCSRPQSATGRRGGSDIGGGSSTPGGLGVEPHPSQPPEPAKGQAKGRPSRRTLLAGAGGLALLIAGGVVGRKVLSSSNSDGQGSHPVLSGHPGEVLWKASAGEEIIFSTPAVASGWVYIAGYDANVYALDAETGSVHWETATGDRVRPSAVVADGLVYATSWDGNLYALDAKNGDQQWKTAFGNQGESFPVAPAVADGRVFLGTTDWYVCGVDGASGQVLWRTWTSGAASSAPAIANGVVYIGTEGYVNALDAETGTAHWSRPAGGNAWSAPAVANGLVYLGNEDYSVYALDTESGEVRWTARTDGEVYSSPAAADGSVYVGSHDKNVYAFDAASGQVRWKAATGGPVQSSPAVSAGAVYVASWDGYLYALGAADGTVRWKTPTGGQVWSSPTVAEKVVYVGSADGKVYAIEA